LANKNQYPAIDVLASISRVMSDIVSPEHKKMAGEIKRAMAVYRDAEDLINIGAYVKGSNEKIDNAIDVIDNILGFITQSTHDAFTFDEMLEMMQGVLS